MNQKKVFTIIACLLILQGIGIYFFSNQIASDSFPELSKQGIWAVAEMGIKPKTSGVIVQNEVATLGRP